MKKLFAVALMLCLLIPAAVAEAPDVKSMSDAELKALYVSVKEELMNRKLWDSATLPAGVYQAGKGLPEGTYECTLLDDGVAVSWGSYENYLKQEKRASYIILKKGEQFTMPLYGDIVWELEFQSSVKPYTGFVW